MKNLCSICGKEVPYIYHRCSYCNLIYCDKHRLPEKHWCVGLPKRGWGAKRSIIPKSSAIKGSDIINSKPDETRSKKTLSKPILGSRKRYVILFLFGFAILALFFILYYYESRVRYLTDLIITELKKFIWRSNEIKIQEELKDISRFYVMKTLSFFTLIRSFGWFLSKIDIPLTLPTTYYDLIFSIKFYSILGYFLAAFRGHRKLNKLTIFCGILVLSSTLLLLEYDRQNLKDFRTEEELLNFLYRDNTNTMNYQEDFDCKDFSWNLIDSAWESGYRLYYIVIGTHALCKAYIVNDNIWVMVEPQTDGVLKDIRGGG